VGGHEKRTAFNTSYIRESLQLELDKDFFCKISLSLSHTHTHINVKFKSSIRLIAKEKTA